MKTRLILRVTSLFSSHEKEVYDNLVRVVGSEMDIRIRQNMFLIKDKIRNKVNTNITTVSSGSLAEGLNLRKEMFDKYIPFVVSTKHSPAVYLCPSS
jgi:hypothetical protein